MLNKVTNSICALILAASAALPLHAQHRRAALAADAQVAAAPISGPTDYEQQPFDVLHYDAFVDLTKAPTTAMRGVCTITLRWVDDPSSGAFYFHLRDLAIDSVLYNGIPVGVTAVGVPASATYHYNLIPPATAHQGDTATVRIVYGGTMTHELGGGTWGGVSSSGGTLFAMGVGFSNNYVSATEHWLPCYDHPSDKATFHGRFRVKQGMTVASNGLLTATTPDSDSTLVYDWRTDIPCATYLLTFAVDAYVPVDFPGQTPPMVIYARPADTAATRYSFKKLPEMVRAFERRFGTYPFEKVGYVNTPIGAMEHQTMVSFPTSLSRGRDTVNSTGAHELSHQWFGDYVSPQDFRHAWLNESFAVFCETVWAEEIGGYARYLKTQEADANQYINSIAASEGIFPLYDFPREAPSSNYPSTIYQKGGVVVGMLRYLLGDSAFYNGIRDHLSAHAYGVATTEMLRSALEARSGRSLKDFFDQWVYGKGWPIVTVRTTKEAVGNGLNRVQVTLTQTQPDSFPTFTELPVEIGFSDTTAPAVYRIITMNGRTATATLDSIPDYTTITVNRGPSVRALMKALIPTSGVSTHVAPDSGTVEFVVKPNPLSTTNTFSVEVKGSGDCNAIEYELYDSAGRRLLLGRTDACQFPIPTAGFNSGVYVLRFKYHSLFYDVPVMIAR